MPVALLRKPLPKPSPDSDPRYRRVMEQLKAASRRTKAHPPAAKKTGDAAAAAKGPPNERVAGGKAKQVEKIRDAKEAKPEPASFLAVLRAEVAKAMPKNLGETEHFDEAAAKMKGGLKGNVAEQKEQSTQDVSGAAKASPAPAGEAKVETPMPKEGAIASPLVPGAQAMPAPKSDADVSLQDSKQNVDQQLKEAEVTTPQLQKANDPRFSAVLASKDEVVKNANAGPTKYRAAEGATLSSASAGANGAARVGAAAMLGVHSGSAAKVLSRQQQQKARDEARRKEVVAQIEAIYETTKTRVETKLSDLDTEVNGIFDRGVDEALQSLTSFVNAKIFRYKLERYLMIPVVGLAAWVRDQFLELPEEVNVFYEEGRQRFQAQMDKLIVRVANLVELRLKEAKAEVAKGQEKIRIFVAGLPKDLQQIGQQAQTDVSARFEELRRGIDDRKEQLAQSLAQKYKDAFDKSNEALKAIQEANRGLVGKFAEKLGEVIKALREFKARVGAVLRKSEETIKLIISDPIGFLSHLIDAVKGGISAFADNITTHLKAGFMQWLFGNLPPGVELPTDFSLGSIFKLVLGVLGITYDRMRAKAVKLLGERNVKIIEKVADYIRTLITGGIAGLWEQVKADLSNLKEMVIDALQDWLITTLIKRAIAKVVLLFNPVGAIVQAIIAIYDIVMFIVEKAKQILAFVESVVNSIADIAAGSISSATKKIEDSLARTIPLLIGFLARLVGISGLAEKIREFILKLQDRVDKAIDKVIAKAVAMVKKLFAGKKEAAVAVAEDPGSVKAKARKQLNEAIHGKADEVQIRAAVDATFGALEGEGLKSLKVVPVEGQPDRFKVMAAASIAEEVLKFDFAKEEERSIAISLSPMDTETTLYVEFIHGGETRKWENSPILSDPGGLHAEEIFLRDHFDRIVRKAERAFDKNKKKTIVFMEINRAPCGSGPKEHNCSAQLASRTTPFRESPFIGFSLGIVGGYGYRDPATKERVITTTVNDLKALALAGIDLTVITKVWEHIFAHSDQFEGMEDKKKEGAVFAAMRNVPKIQPQFEKMVATARAEAAAALRIIEIDREKK